jgi:hypothetical protein
VAGRGGGGGRDGREGGTGRRSRDEDDHGNVVVGKAEPPEAGSAGWRKGSGARPGGRANGNMAAVRTKALAAQGVRLSKDKWTKMSRTWTIKRIGQILRLSHPAQQFLTWLTPRGGRSRAVAAILTVHSRRQPNAGRQRCRKGQERPSARGAGRCDSKRLCEDACVGNRMGTCPRG